VTGDTDGIAEDAHMDRQYVLWLDAVGLDDLPRVGGKNASLGEMIRNLAGEGVRVPGGFALTAQAYRDFVGANDLAPRIRGLLERVRDGDKPLRAAASSIRQLFLDSPFPPDIAAAVTGAYGALSERNGAVEPAVAVHSSATAEDLPEASFAGQQETFLNVVGADSLLDACRRCFALLFTDRAMSYRAVKGFDDLEVALSVGVQLMVRAESSGVMFTLDTETGFPDTVVLSATWGLGETVVQGTVDPDKYVVFKPSLGDGRLVPVLERTVGAKEVKLVSRPGADPGTELLQTTDTERAALVLSDHEVLVRARWAVAVERHYGRAMDMEWAKDGPTGRLLIVQARPETVQARRSAPGSPCTTSGKPAGAWPPGRRSATRYP
jgi:pyruvate, water dikinase